MEVAVGLLIPERIEDDKTTHTIISISIWENHIITYEENNFVWEQSVPYSLVDSNEAIYIDGEETCDDYCFETHRFLE
jgi:hypothetical protein